MIVHAPQPGPDKAAGSPLAWPLPADVKPSKKDNPAVRFSPSEKHGSPFQGQAHTGNPAPRSSFIGKAGMGFPRYPHFRAIAPCVLPFPIRFVDSV
jgi:hypothetical protein